MKKITYLIPCYNEVDTIDKAIMNIKEISYPRKEIIVIDNGSDDGSQEVIKKIKGIKKILRKKNFGIGKTIQEGFKISKGDFFFVYDSDLEYDHLRSIYMMRYAERNKLDVVFGSRFKKNDSKIIKIIERPYFLGSVICTYLINKLYKKNFTDIIGAKLFRVAEIRKVTIDNFHSGYDFSFTSKIIKMKLNVGEVFIKYKPREKGQKKLKYYHLFNAVYQIFKVKFLS
jgi:glycosyltransferase involved in cell wall biosynthesis